jgi:MoaA/NifB/PqqE/SkfB family radical SAM enzyme
MLPFHLLKKVIDEVYPFKFHVSITGGEPLLHPEIIKCIRYIKDNRLCCSLTTNGWLLEQYANEINKKPPDMLCVSLDGPEKIHDEIRGRIGSFRRAMNGIEVLKRNKKRPLLFINATIQKDNYRAFDQLVDDAMRAEVDGMNMQILWARPIERANTHNQRHPEYKVSHGWADKSLFQINMDIFEEVIAKAKAKNFLVNVFPEISKNERLLWYTHPEQLLKGHRPKCAWMMANVFHDGTMRMCDDIIVGDLNAKGFWDIWNDIKLREFRQTIKASKFFPICAGCCSLFRDKLL